MTRSIAACLVATFALTVVPAFAAGAPTGARRARASNFDPGTVTTVSGEVKDIRMIGGRRAQGVHLDVSTAEGVLDVHLGPSWFIDRQPVKIERGDRIEVTGSKIAWAGKPALIAQTVKKGDSTITLRDTAGIPAWSRGAGR